MESPLLREDRDRVAFLTLNRPDKLNSLNVALFKELSAQVDVLAASTDEIECVVLRGAGKCFSAGHDLADISEGEELPKPNFQAEIIERLANLPQPVIVSVHSHCYTGALELALAGDMILCASDAKFADTHAKWGLTPVWGLSQRLPRRVGYSRALDLMATCRTIDGAEAVAIGLANACFPAGELDAAVQAFASSIQQNSPHSVRIAKSLLLEGADLPLGAGLANELYRSPGLGPDAQARIDSFMTRKTRS